MPLVVGEALGVVWQEPPVSIECTASCGTSSSALYHLPESVAGAAVFDPIPHVGSAVGLSNDVQLRMPRVGSAVGLSNDVQLRCHPMVHSMKGGASILPCTSGTICRSGETRHPGGRHNTVPASVIQAVCIATPGSARINVAYRLYSVDELY